MKKVTAQEVMQAFSDIRFAYGESDEYSFVFNKTCILYGRALLLLDRNDCQTPLSDAVNYTMCVAAPGASISAPVFL